MPGSSSSSSSCRSSSSSSSSISSSSSSCRSSSSSSSSSSCRSSSSSSFSSSSSSSSSSCRSSSSSSSSVSSSSSSSSCRSSSSSCSSSSSSSSSSENEQIAVTVVPYGYIVTGYVGSIVPRCIVKDIIFIPASGNDVVTILDDLGNTLYKDTGATAATAYHKHFGDKGSQFPNMNITMSASGDILQIHVTRH